MRLGANKRSRSRREGGRGPRRPGGCGRLAGRVLQLGSRSAPLSGSGAGLRGRVPRVGWPRGDPAVGGAGAGAGVRRWRGAPEGRAAARWGLAPSCSSRSARAGGEDLLTNSADIRFLRVPAVPALSGGGAARSWRGAGAGVRRVPPASVGRGRAARSVCVLGVPPGGPSFFGKGEKS